MPDNESSEQQEVSAGADVTSRTNKKSHVKKSSTKRAARAAKTGVKIQKVIAPTKVPWTFPKHTLDDAIRIAKAVEDKNAGNPMPASSLAVAVGYRLAQDWRFQELLRSANQYGLVEGTGPTAKVSLDRM